MNLWRLLRVTAAIGLVAEAILMWLHFGHGVSLDRAFMLESALFTLSISVLATALFWFSSVKALHRELTEERGKISREQRLNADLKRALDEHALVSIADVSGKIIFANEKFCRVSGYSLGELLGQDHRLVKSGQHDSAYMAAMWRTIARGGAWHGDFCNRRKDGSLYWVDTTIIPFLDENGKPYQYVAVRRDITDLKHAQLRSQRLGERLQWLLDASPSVIYAHENSDRLTECTFVSGNVRNIVGFDSQTMLSKPDFWQNHLHPQDAQITTAQLQRLLESGQATVEYRFLTEQGDYRWICDHARVVHDSAGQPQAIIGSWTDITESKALEQDRLRLLMAAEASGDMIFLTNNDGVIEYANPAFCQFTGWASEEVIGNTPKLIASGQTMASVYQAIWSTLQDGKTWRGRILNRRNERRAHRQLADGSARLPPNKPRRRLSDIIRGQANVPDPLLYWADVTITPIRDPNGGNLGYVSIQRDITEAVSQEKHIALSRQDADARLAAVEILNQPADLKTRFEQLLDRLFELPGLTLQHKGGVFLRSREAETLKLFVLRGDFDEEFIRREQEIPLGACLCGRAALSSEILLSDDCFFDPWHEHQYTGMDSHGHYIIPLSSDAGVVGVMFIYTDPYPNFAPERIEIFKQIGEYMALATLRDQTRRMIEEARDAAQAASQQKSEFLANMSHEIRTPMNGVLGMLELLRRTPLTGEQNEFVDTAAQSAENLLGILNSILDFSKIEAGKLELDYVDFNLRDLVEEVCALLATPAFAKGLELNCFIESKIPAAVHGDPLRLRQVITNLISNAIKFTEQGEVCVEVACLSQDQQRALIKFSVRDTGIGIAPEIQAALFQPFKQADGATTRRFGGTGLGLSISKSLIAGMGGSDIHIESTPGGGSTFWFSLDMEKQRATETTEAPKNLAYRKLLIVDDNATNRSILLRFLEDWGAQVSVAEDALQALELLREADAKASYFDLAILDMNMPNMDGLMLGRAMEQDPAMSRTPRILLSSGGPVSAAERVSAGFRQCLTKPVRQSMLFDAAVSALDEAWIKPSESIQMNAKDLPKMPGRSVLVVEDNAINQRVAQKMLACFEIEVQLAYHGEEALAAMKRQAFDLVLMDCQMPVLDGYAATAAWREYELAAGLRRVPVVALTANALEGDRELCLKAGMDDHLSKPFMLDDLSHILTRWINPSAVGGPPEPSEPLWDAQATLAGLGGDEELLAEIKPLFIEEAPKQLARLNPEGATPTLEQIADAAHTLKGMALRFFATKLVALASHVEQKARASGAGPTEADIAELTAAVEKLVKALKHD